MTLLHKFRPITFFFAGLLLGLGYLGASYLMHMMVLEKAGDRFSEEVSRYQKLKQEYDTAQGRITELSQSIEDTFAQVLREEKHYQTTLKSFQTIVTDMVHVGKSHNLTFLDYHAEPSVASKDIEGARVFTSSLSLGGAFKDIHLFLDSIKDRKDPVLPLHQIEITASSQRNTQIKLTFKYMGELGTFLRAYEPEGQNIPQSFLIVDPWQRPWQRRGGV